ncbi:MAG: DUF4838 domain-containing protein [Lentisphaeria bacterium]|nr:DUF4838 domain-containing protein [Lentisphaeria bacterium]
MKKILFLLLPIFLALPVPAEEFLPVVLGGKAAAALCPVPDDRACLESSMIIEKYLYLSTGAQMDAPANGPRIELEIRKGELDVEGFRFSFPEKNVMRITGGGPQGLKYGALEFCERFIGVRFLFPGPLGEHVPKHGDISVPVKEFSDAPKFLTRMLSSFPHRSRMLYNNWLPLLRGANPWRLAIGHNLSKMFAPAKYGKTHPEYYPLISGKRRIPKPPLLNVHWQPCLTNPGVIAESVRMICDAFAANPDLRTWSLGQTDGSGWCECPDCTALYPKPEVRNRFGSLDRSRYYLTYCNKVAEAVARKYPEAKLSVFAYNNTAIAPRGFKLHPALVPVITYDRMNWTDPERRKLDMERQNSWSAIAKEICWWDYFFTNRYILPRVVCHHLARQLREGYAAGVRHMYAEYIPLGVMQGCSNEQSWGDGPFAYLAYKLLWDPHQDENVILDDWYRTAVGEKAAPHLRKYFELIEDFWTRRVQKTAWFARYCRTYLVWTTHDYLDALEPDFLDRCAKTLDRTCELADEGKCRERAEYFRQGFRLRRNRIEYFLANRTVRRYPDRLFTEPFFDDGFDKGVGAWLPRQGSGKKEEFLFHSANGGIDGSGALELRYGENSSDRSAEKIFRVEKKSVFRIEVFYRCEGTDQKCIPYLSADWCDEKGERLHPAFYSDIHGKPSEKWRKMVLKCAAPTNLPAYLSVRMNISRSKKGSILYDRLSITRLLEERREQKKQASTLQKKGK